MKKVMIIAVMLIGLSCEKNSGKTCYECDKTSGGTGTYSDVGCYTDSEWNNVAVTDNLGNSINKSTRCREK